MSARSLIPRAEVEAIVLRAMTNLNMARASEAQLSVSADAPLFGPDSLLDSMGLVSLLIDIEEALSDRGYEVTLSDVNAMSASRITGAAGSTSGVADASTVGGVLTGVLNRSSTVLIFSMGVCTATE